MKKDCDFTHQRHRACLQKISSRMKALVFMLLCAGLTTVSARTSAQVQVDLKVSNKTLAEVFREITRHTGYKFLYSSTELRNAGKVSIDVQDAELEEVIAQCLQGTGLWYRIEDETVIVSPKFDAPAVPQERITLSGVVKDKDGQPLPGVTVMLEGTTVGVSTDIDGRYELTVPENPKPVLVFSFMGMQNKRVEIGEKRVIDVQMQEEVNRLDEAVVVGYGTTKVKDMTGSVSRLSGKDIETAPMGATLQSMLQGKAPGVNVMIGSASPTAPVSVVIRGASSLSGDSQPLWVIDGVPEYNAGTSGNVSNTLYNLNLTDVESIDILKDASATAIYGSRAANGVVLVTTKRGKEGMTPQLEFSARYGIQTISSNNFRSLNAEEYIAFSKAAVRTGYFTMGGLDYFTRKYIDETYYNANKNDSQMDLETLTDDFFKKDTYGDGNMDWWDLMTHNASTQDYSLGLRGGSKASSYSASLFYKDQKGVVKGGSSKMVGGSLNFDAAIREVIRFKMNLKATARTTNDKNRMIGEILKMRPDYPAYTEDGSINMIDFYVANPLFTLKNTNEQKGRDFSGTLGLEWDIVKGLTFRTTGTAKYNINKLNTFNRATYEGAKSSANVQKNENYTYVWDNTLSYLNTWKRHNLVAMAGFSVEKYESDGLTASGSGFPDDDVLVNLGSAATKTAIGSSYQSNALASFFARMEYKYNNRYLATLNFRADGSSKFGPDKRWGYFPSGAVAWIVTEENFLKDYSHIVSYLKLRGSIGTTGSQNLGNYDWRTLIGSGIYNGLPGSLPSTLGNNILQWESQTQKEIGLDYGFWNDRVRGSLGFYQKKVDNLLYSDPVPYSSSFSSVTQNIGSLKNNGIEFDIRVDILKKPQHDLTWDVDLNIARNRTYLEKLNSVETFFGGGAYQQFKIEEGGLTGVFYGYRDAGRLLMTGEELVALKNINPETGLQTYYRTSDNTERRGDVYIMDLDGDGQITADGDREVIGNANPDFFGGFGTTLYWKGLMFNATFSYSVGADRLWQEEQNNAGDINSYNRTNKVLDSWIMNPGVNTSYPRASYYGRGGNNIITDRYIHDASYLRLTALNLSYRLPSHLYKNSMLNAVEFTFQATNLFTCTKYPGMDPQGNFSTSYSAFYSMGIDNSTYPSARTFNFGVKITLK